MTALPTPVTRALAQALANTIKSRVSIVAENGAFYLRDAADLAVYGGRASVVASFDPPPGFPDDDDGTEDGGGPPRAIPTYACTAARPCTNPRHDHARVYAVTAQSIAIDSRMTRCVNCDGTHATWRCPETSTRPHAPEPTTDRIIANALDRIAHPHPCSSCGDLTAADICAACQEDEPAAIYDTSELAQLWATSRTLLAAKLARLSRAQLHVQAIAFAAWLDTRTHAGLSAASVLHIWETFILAGGDPAMQQRAA